MKASTVILFILCSVCSLAQKAGTGMDSLLAALPSQQADSNKVKLLLAIAKQYTTTEPKKGFSYAHAALDLSRDLHWKRGEANAYNNLGLLVHDTGNGAGAIPWFEKSLVINQELDAKPFMIANLNNIGRSYQQASDYTKASDYFFRGLSIAEASSDNEQAALLGTNLTSLFTVQEDYAKAEKYALMTIQKGEAAHALVHVSKAYEMLGVVKLQTHDTPNAVIALRKAMAIDEQLGNQTAVISVLSNLATAESNPEKQLPMLLDIQARLDSLAPASENAMINLANMALAYFNFANTKSGSARATLFDRSAASFNKAIQLSEQLNAQEIKAQLLQARSDLQAATGNYRAALDDYKSFVHINDSIFSQSNKNKIASLESQRAIDLKNKELENSTLLLSNQRKRMWLLVAGVAFFALLGLLVYRQARVRKQLNDKLIKLNDELSLANAQKNRFFGILSHDLRSPVANLINFLQLQKAKPGLLSSEKAAEREEKIAAAAESVLQTMETILLWSKGQMEQFSPSMKPVPVASVFGYLQHFFAGNERVHFSYAAADGLTAFTDQQYLQTILQNIGSNAVKVLAAVDTPQIDWKAWKENDRLLITVTDNGPGAGEEKFRALYDEQAMTQGGSGLGLHIIRDLSKAIGCTVECSSESGKGTVFTLSLEAAV